MNRFIIPVLLGMSSLCAEQIFVKEPHKKNPDDGKHGLLYEKYLHKGELNAYAVKNQILPLMKPLEINDALRDIRKFIEKYVETAVKNFPEKVGEAFLTEVLHAYGHIITFIENAWVDRQTLRVFEVKTGETPANADPLVDYWWSLEHYQGVHLHCHKFYASCIDHLNTMVKAYMLFPCYDCTQWEEMEDRWFRWLEKVTAKIHENPTFGGYYQETIKLFRDVFALWRQDFEKKQERPSWGDDDL